MGCCNSTSKIPQQAVLMENLQNAIDSDCPERIRIVMNMIHKAEVPDLVDQPIVALKEIDLNPLSYATWQGNTKAFKCLKEEFNAKVSEMEKLLSQNSISPLDIMCQRGFHELLIYYIPFFIEYEASLIHSKEEHSVTMEFDEKIETFARISYTPIQKACEMGNIQILLNVFNYFKKNPNHVPHALDIEFQEESTGENCVLIACRTGNYSMIKFLNEIVKANFNVKNKNEENAINVCLAGGKKRSSKVFLECLIYLIDTAKVDFTYQYEESLLLANDKETINYLEQKLRGAGINITKKELEEMNKLKPKIIHKVDQEINIEDEEPHFNLREYIEDGEYDTSALSSIANFESVGIPFISVLGNNSILKFSNT